MADRNGATFYVFNNDGVSADFRMCPDFDRPQNLGAGADVDMVPNLRKSSMTSGSYRNLLKYKAVCSDPRAGMDHDAIWMRDQEATADLAVKWNVSTRHDAPKTMPNNKPFEESTRERVFLPVQALIAANSQQQLSPGIPEPPGLFSCPIWDLRVKTFLQRATLSVDFCGIGRAATSFRKSTLTPQSFKSIEREEIAPLNG